MQKKYVVRLSLSREVAKEANANDTIEITVSGERLRILRKCQQEMPPLELKQGESDHIAACWVTK